MDDATKCNFATRAPATCNCIKMWYCTTVLVSFEMEELVVEDGQIKVGKTKATITNYTFEIACAVVGPKNSDIPGGHVFRIKNTYREEGYVIDCFQLQLYQYIIHLENALSAIQKHLPWAHS